MITNKKLALIISGLVLILFLGGIYGFALGRVSKKSEVVNFVIQSGTSKITIADNLKKAGLIRSKNALVLHLFFNSDLNLKAGTYELNRNMKATDIINAISDGKVKTEEITFTFIEGKNVNDLASLIAEKFNYTEEEVKNALNNKDFLQNLIKKYDFLTETILNGNIYYALEGYLFPDTYQVSENARVEEIITKMLDNTSKKLSNLDLSTRDYSIHEILTMASIVELEAVNESDRRTVAQVIYKRLAMKKGLGMDVTTYYAAKKKMGDVLMMEDLRMVNPYNTSESNSSMAGKLPIGPICNPSLESIKAVLNPSDTDYIYFYANVKTHEVFFAKTYEEFIAIQRRVG